MELSDMIKIYVTLASFTCSVSEQDSGDSNLTNHNAELNALSKKACKVVQKKIIKTAKVNPDIAQDHCKLIFCCNYSF